MKFMCNSVCKILDTSSFPLSSPPTLMNFLKPEMSCAKTLSSIQINFWTKFAKPQYNTVYHSDTIKYPFHLSSNTNFTSHNVTKIISHLWHTCCSIFWSIIHGKHSWIFLCVAWHPLNSLKLQLTLWKKINMRDLNFHFFIP